MAKTLLRTNKEITEIYERHVKTVYRVCFPYMKSAADTEDAVQNTFLNLMRSAPAFENEEHEKAWLIRTAANLCKDSLRNRWRKHEDLADYQHLQSRENLDVDETLGAVMALPDKYKSVVYLHYYEGYTCVEIAKILGKPQSTVRVHLFEARNILRERLGGDFDEK
ncbi:MAG: RNA polymerase sigma factor [Oscillospiraceae bacterium]|jgi:RNA polymerase sigma-70 factor (ECF subfamily)|nr:RNA polymerase sigma factor [Oscillospiraceae bacterium]